MGELIAIWLLNENNDSDEGVVCLNGDVWVFVLLMYGVYGFECFFV